MLRTCHTLTLCNNRGKAVWDNNTEHSNASDVNRVDWCSRQHCGHVYLLGFLTDVLVVRTCEHDSLENLTLAEEQVSKSDQICWSSNRATGEKWLLCEWTPQKRRDWQSQTSLFLFFKWPTVNRLFNQLSSSMLPIMYVIVLNFVL